MNIEYYPVHCPNCHRRVANRTNKQKTNVVARCITCNKIVVFDVENTRILLKDIPLRKSSSGLGF